MAAVPIAPAGGLDMPKTFRFMNFPAEMRNQVYANLLCPVPEVQLDEQGTNHWQDVAHHFDTAILRTNRQIHAEARDVMLRGNQFVRIIARGVTITAILTKIPIHTVVHTHFPRQDHSVKHFKGAVMSYQLLDQQEIRDHGSTPSNTCDLVIFGRDLDTFVRGLADPELDSPRMSTGTHHCIYIHDTFKKSRNPAYSNIKTQKRLLQPFRSHFHGFTEVRIEGRVDPELAASIVEEVRHESVPQPDVFIQEIKRLKDEGNSLFRTGAYIKAGERWRRAVSRLQRFRSSNIWGEAKAQLGPGFFNALAEIFFILNSNLAQATLAEMWTYDATSDAADLSWALERIGHNGQIAHTSSDVFGSAWQPTPRQEAKLCFRSAQAARLAGDLPYAQGFINGALQLLPNDPEVRKEADEITRSGLRVMNSFGIFSGLGI